MLILFWDKGEDFRRPQKELTSFWGNPHPPQESPGPESLLLTPILYAFPGKYPYYKDLYRCKGAF